MSGFHLQGRMPRQINELTQHIITQNILNASFHTINKLMWVIGVWRTIICWYKTPFHIKVMVSSFLGKIKKKKKKTIFTPSCLDQPNYFSCVRLTVSPPPFFPTATHLSLISSSSLCIFLFLFCFIYKNYSNVYISWMIWINWAH